MGLFPRVVDADNDGRKDLLTGEAEGTIRLYRNINTDDDPRFDGGTLLRVGEPGLKTDIDVGQRTAPAVVDWNNDGRRDLVVGSKDGRIHLFINEGTDAAWDFRAELFIQEDAGDLIVPTLRASPEILDADGDGAKDLLVGNTEGQILLYRNLGSDASPLFSGAVHLESDEAAIDLPGTLRSRPFLCDWNDDGTPDMLVGYGDGLVRLYRGASEPADATTPLAVADRLFPPYPNPFNPAVAIPFMISRSGRARLSVHDAAGRRIAVLVDEVLPAGRHETQWQGENERGEWLPSGMYLIRLETGGTVSTRKVALVR